ncbi:MAG: class I SAM-dependent methyltransferase [Phycisphaerae bacterium]|nr:class I SAM-dependent methyltransferase [Phycisphaerae bacterium]
MPRTKFYEIVVKRGFYGVSESGLCGKKDNVRKFWEDVFIKMSIRPAIEQLLEQKDKIRVIDLGCGSGEGLELLTHIPPSTAVKKVNKEFVIVEGDIEIYQGVDISPAMIKQGKQNYSNLPQADFVEADLSEGFPFMQNAPYDIYFSSYASLSHLNYAELEHLTEQIFSHISSRGYMVFDLHGRYSPEWPGYWSKDCHLQLPYTMAYLLPPQEQDPNKIKWFDVTYYSGSELIGLIESVADASGKKVKIINMRDRSIFVGRHMDTSLFKKQRHSIRTEVNRLFDHGYRGRISGLGFDIDYLEEVKDVNHQAWTRIHDYYNLWQTVVNTLHALMNANNTEVRKIIESSPEILADELKMLAWLYRNADRFPVVDFWASVMGPQVACILRNLEFSLPQGLGCGHSLFCIVEIENEKKK